MPNVSQMWRSKYVKLGDLGGVAHRVVVEKVVKELISGEPYWIAYFEGKKKGLVLRMMISQELAGLLGDNTDGWKGQEFELYEGDVMLNNGDIVPAFRARRPLPVGAQADDPSGF